MAVGDSVRDDEGNERVVVWDGSRASPPLLAERREMTADIYNYGFDLGNRAPWHGQKRRRKTGDSE